VVSGVYRNEPRQGMRERSPIHHGAFLLRVGGNPATSLEGEYWPDRRTSGEMATLGRRKKAFETFADASAAFQGS